MFTGTNSKKKCFRFALPIVCEYADAWQSSYLVFYWLFTVHQCIFRWDIGWRIIYNLMLSSAHKPGPAHSLTISPAARRETQCRSMPRLVKKKNNASIIQRWFGFTRPDEQQNSVICRECHKQVVSKNGSASDHFKRLHHHKFQPEQCVTTLCCCMPTLDVKTSQSSTQKQNDVSYEKCQVVRYNSISDR